MDTYLFPSDGGAVVLPIMGAMVALAIAAMPRPRWMTARDARKWRQQRLGLATIGVLLVPAALLSPSSTFTKLAIQGDALLLHYDMSTRRDTVPMAEIRELEWRRESQQKKQRGSVLLIYTKGGDSYASTPVPMLDAALMEPRLAARVTITPEPQPASAPLPSVFFHLKSDSTTGIR